MFDQLFERPHALARQLSAPLVEERRRYLCHCHTQKFSRSSLRLTAQLLVATAEYLKLDDRPSAIITLQEVEEAGSRWSRRESLPPIENPRLSRQRFVHSATGWLAFLGRLESPSTPGKPYDPLIADFAEFLRNERGLSTATIELRSFTVRAFPDRLGVGERSLDTICVADVDSALAQQVNEENYARVTIQTCASSLRSFFRYAEMHYVVDHIRDRLPPADRKLLHGLEGRRPGKLFRGINGEVGRILCRMQAKMPNPSRQATLIAINVRSLQQALTLLGHVDDFSYSTAARMRIP